MAKTIRSRKSSGSKGISPITLYVLAVGCFVFSKLFANKIDVADYAFAALGFVLFALAFWKYFKNRKR
ncbi:hypothetical protein HUK80_09425 [Flavobacterium sp. MAH-1]|uniref:Uncharacterized protein n=1 Tax=Flavobacterium agri TaxID=2743471 RepID=A0A7Y8Y239_9FLAO|nr:hypothetical protein [Flavobacterium agri]NUY81114.1 hypothetical protein [Flavobacterium agri]NYA71138.1 hypothetical protein [Flavobacterium agri]